MKMRMTLLSPLALGAVAFAALAEPVVLSAAEPARLTGTQMDAVTVSALAVGVGAWATCRRLQHLRLYQHLNKGFKHAQRQC